MTFREHAILELFKQQLAAGKWEHGTPLGDYYRKCAQAARVKFDALNEVVNESNRGLEEEAKGTCSLKTPTRAVEAYVDGIEYGTEFTRNDFSRWAASKGRIFSDKTGINNALRALEKNGIVGIHRQSSAPRLQTVWRKKSPGNYGAVFCGHANEMPSGGCPCNGDCYCRVEGPCKGRK